MSELILYNQQFWQDSLYDSISNTLICQWGNEIEIEDRVLRMYDYLLEDLDRIPTINEVMEEIDSWNMNVGYTLADRRYEIEYGSKDLMAHEVYSQVINYFFDEWYSSLVDDGFECLEEYILEILSDHNIAVIDDRYNNDIELGESHCIIFNDAQNQLFADFFYDLEHDIYAPVGVERFYISVGEG
jgi:hypothetical protein